VVPAHIDAAVRPAIRPLIRRLAAYSRTPMPPIVRSFVEQLSNPAHGLIDYPPDRDDIIEL
jgi:hypothetical protein